jgi:hypothetical protein
MAEFKLGRLRFVWQGTWTTGHDYVKDDIVRYGGKAYVCLVGNTSAGSQYGFNADLSSGKWALMSDGVSYISAGWSTGTTYKLGDILTVGASTYICTTANVAGATFAGDSSKWTLLSTGFSNKGDWTPSTGYSINDVVAVGGQEYICTTGHTSNATPNSGFYSDSSKWTIFASGFMWQTSWFPASYYNLNDVVKVGGKEYICILGHTSTNTPNNSGFFTDLGNNKWELFVDGQSWQGAWTQLTYYNVGDLVSYGGTVYICNAGHTSGTNTQGLENNQGSWTIFTSGFGWRGDYTNGPTTYKINDVVNYGPDLYICTSAYTTSTATLNLSKWELFVAGLEFQSTYSDSTSYALGDVVTYGGYVYASKSTNNLGNTPTTTSAYWDIVTTGFNLRGAWSASANPTYRTGDVVNYGSTVYVAKANNANTNPSVDTTSWTLLTSGINWRGAWNIGTAYIAGDAVGWNSNSYIAVAPTTGDDPSTDNGSHWNVIALGASSNVTTTKGDMIFYNTLGNDRLPIGTAGQVLKVDGTSSPTWGYFGELTNVYYVAPNGANTLANGQGKTIDKPFLTIAYALANAPFTGNAVVYVKTGTYQETCPMSIPANTYLVGDSVGSVTVSPTSGTNTQNMFLLRNNTGIANMTLTGLVGTLGSVNGNGTKRPGGAAYISIDSGGAGITTTNPIINNITILGTGATASATGIYINETANTGSDTVTINDVNIILSDGIGIWATGSAARVRASSVFVYYAYAGMLAEGGARITSVGSTCSYGTYGAIAEGTSSIETPTTGTVNTQTQQASVASALYNSSGQILWLEYANAGQTYSSASYSLTSGSGYGAFVGSANYVTNAVPEVRVITGGTGYVTTTNIAQVGTTTTITLNASDTAATGAYVGMRIILSSGTGAGQYGYITAYNGTTKIASVSADSTSAAGWDVAVAGTTIAPSLDTTTRYIIEPRATFSGTGTGLLVRAIVTSGSVSSMRVINPGTGYTVAPSITVIDPNATVAATFTVRQQASGVLAQPTWTNRGTGYSDLLVTITGNGYADYQAVGSNIYISGLASIPTAGGNVTISGTSYTLTQVISTTGSGPYIAYVQLGTPFTTSTAPANGTAVSISYIYSMVRLQGHAFAFIGSGNTVSAGYPNVTTSTKITENQTWNVVGGRVFFDSMDQDGIVTLGNLITSNESTGIASINANLLTINGLSQLQFASGGATITQFSTDGTLAANSNSLVPTQAAIRSFVAAQLSQGVATLTANNLSTGRISISGQTVTTSSGNDLLLTAAASQYIQINSQTNLNAAVTLTSSGSLTLNSGSTLTINGNTVINTTPTVATDITNKRYVDRVLSLNTRWTNYWV